MNILHVCNDFLGSKVHRNLYLALEEAGSSKQAVFVPLRSSNNTDLKTVIGKSIHIYYSNKQKKKHRILFSEKINYLYRSLKNQIDLGAVDLIHATTLFSDGALALKAYEDFNIPYVVTVRATDVSMFLKYRPDLILTLIRILKHASKVVFISDSLKWTFSQHYLIRMFRLQANKKYTVIYNGLDDYWLGNLSLNKTKEFPTNFLYVGSFIKRKNVIRLIKSFVEVSKNYNNRLKLNIVGGGGSEEAAIQQLALTHSDIINFIGPVRDKDRLKSIYRENDVFAMISFAETFGLVYLEALSQGLPVIYTKNQGIDGVFKKMVGVSVDAGSYKSIKGGIIDIINNYGHFQLNSNDFVEFNWSNIAENYLLIYQENQKIKITK